MTIRWSPSTGHFYHAELSGGAIPSDAVPVTSRRHAELIEGRAAGREIRPDADGKPQLTPQRRPGVTQLRAWAVLDVKREARRRILAIASLERQANDNAAMVEFALSAALTPSAIDEVAAAHFAARERRRQIDAIRAASNAIEATIARMPAANLNPFDAAADRLWPAQE